MSAATKVVNPATEQVIAEVPVKGVEETDEAVARAVAAGPAWRAVAPADRARLMRRFAAVVEDHAEELAQLETANVGKPIAESRDEAGMVAEVLYFYAGAVDKHRGATVPVAGGVDMTFHEPLGVVGAIIPWNFPIAITSWKVGPALATGNTIVVKPAEITPSRRSGWPSWPSMPAFPRVCCRWWWARVRSWVRTWSSTPTWPRWRSRDRPRSVGM